MLAQGAHFKEVDVLGYHPGADSSPLAVDYSFGTVFADKLNLDATGKTQLELQYGAEEIQQFDQNPDGSFPSTPSSMAAWDRITNVSGFGATPVVAPLTLPQDGVSPSVDSSSLNYFVRFTLGDGSTLTVSGNQLFELEDFSFGDENAVDIGSATGGAGAGKVSFNPLELTFDQPGLDPQLFKMLAQGAHFKEVDVLGYHPGADSSPLAVDYSFGTVFADKLGLDATGKTQLELQYGAEEIQQVNNHPPLAVDDTGDALAGGTAAGNVLANDSDPDSDNLAVSAVDGLSANVGTLLAGTYGNLTLNGDGSYSYSADNAPAIAAGPTGSHLHDIFSYTASDGRGGVADASLDISLDRLPVVGGDTGHALDGGTAAGNVLANDSDPDGDPLQLVGVTGGSLGQGVVGRFGTLVINGDGNFTYASNKSAPLPSLGVAQDLFTYSESDGHGAIVQGTLTITVIPNGTNYIAGTPGETIDAGNGKGIIDASLGSQTVVGGNGADTLIGGPHDVLTGGNGPDTFEFGPSSGPNTITDFDVHNDTIVFDRSLFAGFADIQAHTKQVGADTVITYHGTDTLILQHVTATSLRASDFSLGTVSFGSSATLGFAGNALNGTPTPSDGTQAGTLALLGQYSTAGFGASGTSQSGTHGPDPLPNQPQFLAAHA
jgi:VCBS repeat-containing protein